MVEVRVPRAEYQVVLEREGGDPHVLYGNRRSLPPQLQVDRGVVVSRSIVGMKNLHTGQGEETRQPACDSDTGEKFGPDRQDRR